MRFQTTLEDIINCDQERYVRRISYEEVKPFLLNIHYARRIPCITDAFGLIYEGKLIGIVTYGIPASHSLCIGLAGEENQDNIKELNRLCLLPEYNGNNNASFLVGKSLKLLDNGTFVVSYADTAWGHYGYIYQATNFLYTGKTKERTDKFVDGGHSRHYEKFEGSGLRQSRSAKHRYIYLVGDKRTKKRMLSELKYKIQPYPKGKDTRYNVDDPVPIIKTQITKES